ncbi:4Fe-4S dicluster domain-containing protein [bacterium]|nr:4Fe-4S dicluster domain-containing protein [bacterium]
MPKIQSIDEFKTLKEQFIQQRSSYKYAITMCAGTACQACGCLPIATAFEEEIEKQGLQDQVLLRKTGCQGFCEQGPLVIVEPANIFYRHLKAADIPDVISKTVLNGEVIERLLYTPPGAGAPVQTEESIPFYQGQNRLLLGDNRHIAPKEIGDYFARGGYEALAKVLSGMSQDDVIEEVKQSGLRGRGGGGYPAGKKWEQSRNAPGEEHYVICNADEGDPGAYMDRSLLEGNPHSVLEGMLIGAYAVGAREGYIYVRAEYPLAVAHTNAALDQAREYGLLGEKIMGTDFSFDIRVARGGGAFVCGESTALMASLEGHVGEPRPKDVHTVEKGLRDQPTVLNNVETWANVPKIIANGSAWFAGKGTEGSKGTKIFALTGQVKNTGLVEVEMGTTLREIIFDIGGGAKNGREVKAVQTGGPSGGCLPVSQFDLPVDFDQLYEAGSMMGSGGMVVMDDTACMVDVAKYFLRFLQDESCGKCVPCRVGVGRMLEILNDISEGNGTHEQLELLKDLAWTIGNTSLCALGKTAPNPVLSTLQYFEDEYMAHLNEKRCPAGVCRSLVTYRIDQDLCSHCGECIEACPHDAIAEEIEMIIDEDKCEKCGICEDVCPVDAISKV